MFVLSNVFLLCTGHVFQVGGRERRTADASHRQHQHVKVPEVTVNQDTDIVGLAWLERESSRPPIGHCVAVGQAR